MLKYIKITSNACGKVVAAPIVVFNVISKLINRYERKLGYDSDLNNNRKISDDWNKIGNDMWKVIANYDQDLTKEKQEK